MPAVLALIATAATTSCQSDGGPVSGADASVAPTASVATPPTPKCVAAAKEREQVAALLAEGKLDRAARLLATTAEACPAGAAAGWAEQITVLADLGRVEAVQRLAKTIEGSAQAPAAAKQAAADAHKTIAPLVAPIADRAAARREARRLFFQATIEPDNEKARDLFLQSAATLPPGGSALYQAGRAEKRLGHKVATQRLFDRALAALERASGIRTPELAPIDVGQHGLKDLAAGSGGRLVLAVTDTGTIVLDALGWQPRFAYDVPSSAAALSHDGTLVVYGSKDGIGSCSLIEATCTHQATGAPVTKLALSRDGETLAVLLDSGVVSIVDGATLKTRRDYRSTEGPVTALSLSPKGDRLYLGTKAGKILVVNTKGGALESQRQAHTSAVVALELDAHGRRLISADKTTLRLGGVDDEGELLPAEPSNAQDLILDLALSPDGRTLLVERSERVEQWGLDDKTRVAAALEAAEGYDAQVAPAYGRTYLGLNRMASSRWIVTYKEVLAVKSTDPKALATARPIDGSFTWGSGGVPHTQFLAAGTTLLTVNDVCDASHWDLAKAAFVGMRNDVSVFRNCPNMRLSPDGKVLFVLENYRQALALDLVKGSSHPVDGGAGLIDVPVAPEAPKSAVEAVAAGSIIAWADKTGAVHVGPRDGKQPKVGTKHRDSTDEYVRDPDPPLAISPKGRFVAFRSGKNEAQICDSGTGEMAHQVHQAGISGVAFGADETAFVSALDGTVTMIRPDGSRRTLPTPHGAPVYGLAAVRKGQLIVGAVDQGPIFIWSANDGELRATLTTLSHGAMATTPAGETELFGKVHAQLACHFGPFVFGLELCSERLLQKNVLRQAITTDVEQP